MPNNEYTELVITAPGDKRRKIYGSDTRQVAGVLSEKFEDCMMDNELFHRDSSGIPIESFPHIRFGGGNGVYRITAIGNEAENILRMNGHKITKGLSRETGKPLVERWSTGHISAREIKRKPFYGVYGLNTLVIQHPTKQRWMREIKDSEEGIDQLTEIAKQKIQYSLERQADYLGIDLPDDYLIDEITFAGKQPVPGCSTINKHFTLSLRKVQFKCSLNLQGPWAAGHLTSRGLGRIFTITE